MTTSFTKPYKNPSDLIALLQSRGLIIADTPKAETILRAVGYYRFSAYLYPFIASPKENHIYKQGSRFEDALLLYQFDHRLRLFLFDVIAKVEIGVRSAIANLGSKFLNDKFWITNPVSYANPQKFRKTIDLINAEYNRSREDFIEHFRISYSDPYPPAWELIEILPFGVVTRIYENISDFKVQKKIAQYFALNSPVFKSWLTIVTLTRNACCHHSRIWNKANTIRSLAIRRPSRPWISTLVNSLRIFYDMCIIKWFLDIIMPGNHMKDSLKKLLQEFPTVDIAAMGFPADWENEPLWK